MTAKATAKATTAVEAPVETDPLADLIGEGLLSAEASSSNAKAVTIAGEAYPGGIKSVPDAVLADAYRAIAGGADPSTVVEGNSQGSSVVSRELRKRAKARALFN